MKNLKKVLALVLACVMVFGTVAMAGSVYPDVADDAIYAESVKALSALGIIKGDENGNFNPDATITRAEMAKILCTMLGTGDIAQANTIFSDVPSSHWASGYVNYAQQYGCIAGYGDGTFGPEDPVTYEQVIKLIMAALGYTPMAEENGGYPTGYLYAAADMEVTERAVGNGPEPAPRGTVAILVCNAMNTPVMERAAYGTSAVWEILDGGSYNSAGGAVVDREFKTLLTSKHKVFKVGGKVENTYKGKTSLKEGFVDTVITDRMMVGVVKELDARQITDARYELYNISAAGTDAVDYVGYESYLYFKVDALGDVTLICVTPKSARNKSIVIDDVANIYDSAVDGTTGRDIPKTVWKKVTPPSAAPYYAPSRYIFSYWNDRDTENRMTTVDLDPAVSIYTNNAQATTISSSPAPTTDAGMTDGSCDNTANITAFVPDKGSVTLVDTDNDGDYDLIKVVKIDTVVVDTTNAKTDRINFKQDGKNVAATKLILNKDANANLREYSITIDGAEADISELKEYDVLSVVTNDWSDPTYVDITVTRNVIEGKVTAKKYANAPSDYVVIGGEKYKTANVYYSYPSTLDVNDITVDDEGKFYLNADGEIVLMDTTSVLSGDYAYLYSTGDGNFAGETYVRMFTKDGADVTYRIADKIKINGVQADSATDVFTVAELNKMFVTASPAANATAMVVSDMFPAAPVATATSFGNQPLTAANMIKALVDGADKDARTGYAISTTYVDSDLNTNPMIAKFVTYKANSNNELVELTISSNKALNKENQFGYEGTPSSAPAEWKEALAKFDGSKSLPDNAVIFFIPTPTSSSNPVSIADYSVKTVADLVDGTKYTPYFFTKTEDGPAAVLMLGADATIDTKSPFAIFAGYSSIKVDGDDAFSVNYWKDGALVAEPLTVAGTATVAGEKTAVPSMQPGDAFIYSLNDDGLVKDIFVIFSAGDDTNAPVAAVPSATASPYATQAAALSTYMSVPSASPAPFQFYGNPGNTADNEIIYGIVAKTKSITDGVRLTLIDSDGDLSAATTVNVPNTAKVVYYNATANDTRKLSEAVVTDITASSVAAYDQTTGNFDYNSADFSVADINYVFVRVYKDVVTEVILVRYASDF